MSEVSASSSSSVEGSQIAAFYAGKGVLITGGTGFLGKVILEKLLRSCPDIKQVYLLARGRGQVTARQRIDEVIAGVLFDRLRKEQPNFADKISVVNGELTEEHLGMKDEDFEPLKDNIQIVIHSAATIKFTEKIQLAVDLNVLGVRRMLEFCHALKKCLCFLHMSTAYAHTDREFVEERIYTPAIEPQKLISLTDGMPDDLAEIMTPHFIGPRPNTYTYTKSIAEYIVSTEGKDLPAIVFRPSVVSAIWKDPLPGWLDNFNGVAALATAIGTGVARTMVGDTNMCTDVIPVDVVASYTIAAIWYSSTRLYPDVKETPVFNCESSGQNRMTIKTWGEELQRAFIKYPLEKNTVRRVKFCFTDPKNQWLLKFRNFVHHTIPAHVLDWFLTLMQQRPKMVKIFGKMERGFKELGYFTTHEWRWEEKRNAEVLAAMNDADRAQFTINVKTLHWRSYMEAICVGIKKYVFKESIEDLRKARANKRRQIITAIIGQLILFASFATVFYKLLRRIISFLAARIPALKPFVF